MRVAVLIALVFSIPIATGTIKPVDLSRFWVESGMNKHLLHEQISDAKCASSKEYLQSCQDAMEVARKNLPAGAPELDADFDKAIEQIDQFPQLLEPKEQVFGEMMAAHLRTFDPHASFMPRAVLNYMLSADNGGKYGLGTRVAATGIGLMVREVSDNSPAKAGGLKVNDRIVSINGTPVKSGLESYKDLERLAGKEGDVLNLQVIRQGHTRRLKVHIGVIPDQNVTQTKFQIGNSSYGYVRLSSFRDESCTRVEDAVESLGKDIQGLILDLRENPGGELDQGICVAGLFLGKQNVVGTKSIAVSIPVDVDSDDGNEDIEWEPYYRSPAFPDLPLVVLVDSDSASASEIVAAALQDHHRALIVGERSFGKGTVQSVQDYPSNGRFAIGYTGAVFFRPSGQANQLFGVTPEFEVPFRFGASEAERQAARELDLYPNALGKQSAAVPSDPPSSEVQDIRACISGGKFDQQAMQLLKRQSGGEDYQKAYGLAVLGCEGTLPKHNTSVAADSAGKPAAD